MLDPVEFGKSMAAIVKEAQAPLLKRIEQLEARQLERGEKGADGKDGTSVTTDDVAPMIAELVAKAVAEIPPPKDGVDGKDGANGADGASVSAADVAAMVDSIVAEYVAQLPPPVNGVDGKDGKDADPIDIADVARELATLPEIKTVLDLLAAEAVVKHFEAHPVQHGKDGRDGKDGEPGPRGSDGAKGDPGRDGLDVKDMFRADGGRLVAVMSDGSTKDLGEFVGKDGRDGKDGKDGRDGLGFEDCTAEVGDGVATLKFVRGDVVKSISFPIPDLKHVGFWGPGAFAKAGQFTTHDGHLWMARRDTSETPNYQAADWQLAARKGADGARGPAGKDYKPREPVKLKGGDDA
jgi:hypothetical protein